MNKKKISLTESELISLIKNITKKYLKEDFGSSDDSTEYVGTILTDKNVSDKENTDINKASFDKGYHFNFKTLGEAKDFKNEWEKKGSYLGERIVKVTITPKSSGYGGIGRS